MKAASVSQQVPVEADSADGLASGQFQFYPWSHRGSAANTLVRACVGSGISPLAHRALDEAFQRRRVWRSADRYCVAISARPNILRFDMIIGSAWVTLLADWLTKADPHGCILGFLCGGSVMMVIGASYAGDEPDPRG